MKIKTYIIWLAILLPVCRIQGQENKDCKPEECLESFQESTIALWEKLYTTTDSLFGVYSDSLENRTSQFRELLEIICREDSNISYNYCFTQNPPPIKVATSDDRKVRLFTRNTWLGGSMPDFETFIQYRTEDAYYLENASALWQGIPTIWFDTIQIISENGESFYLLSGSTQLANMYPYFLIIAIRIKEGEIIREPLFVTDKQENDYLSVAYRKYNHELPDILFRDGYYPRIVYDADKRIIYVPRVQDEDDEYLDGTVDIYTWNPEELRFIKKTGED